MKKFLGTMMWTILNLIAVSQPVKTTLSGTITDAGSKNPIAGVSVQVGNRSVITDDQGQFRFANLNPGNYKLKAISLGYASFEKEIIIGKTSLILPITLISSSVYLQPLEVRALRASDKAPFAKSTLSSEQIAKTNLGQDIPFLLNQLPSVVVNSDAGNGVGYTAIRIRGSDATRINVTLNGIPYNDAESMGTYFVDLPDFSSSVNSIQVQRGVGTSTNGSGAFGASINLSTNEFHEKAYAESNNSYGSFHTWKNNLKVGTGLIDGHFTVDARLNRINSDGYIDRATCDLKSFYFSTAYLNKRSSLRLNVFSGKEKTYQAWYGVPEDQLATNRTMNPAGTEKPGTPYDNQTDNYTQTHYQLFFNHAFNARWAFNTALFMTDGNGYYEEYKAGQDFSSYGLPNITVGGVLVTSTDLVRQRWLDNRLFGQIASLHYKDPMNELTIGGGWSKYDGQHYGNISWLQIGIVNPNYHYYDYPATKKDANIYTKWQHQLSSNWYSFVDLQYRGVSHDMKGFEGNPTLNVNRKFDFFNPKAGLSYQKNGWQAYVSFAIAHKEPNRDDFQAGVKSQPNAETLNDLEIGIERRKSEWHWSANVYWMNYQDQLVLTGQINDVGSYTRINVPKSYRLGIELQGGIILSKQFQVSGNLTLSKNKIKSYTEYVDNWDTGDQNPFAHQNTDIAFSPSVVAGMTLSWNPINNLEISLLNKYVGKEYLDNAQSENRKLNPFFLQDIRFAYTIKKCLFSEWNLIAQVNNLYNKKYEPNGYTYNYIYNKTFTTENGYYPMAGTNFLLGINIKL